jgi:hypothetical protein
MRLIALADMAVEVSKAGKSSVHRFHSIPLPFPHVRETDRLGQEEERMKLD